MLKRNLILSIIHGYDYPLVQPFIKSLKKTGYNGDLVIFVSETVSKTTKTLLRKSGAILIDYRSDYPFIDGYSTLFNDITPSITLNNYRFLFYLQYIKDNPDKYNNILLTDIRDVVFQSNIFDSLIENKIYYFLEDKSEIFRTSKLNYNWCLLANGPEITNQIIDQNVSCAGIVVGSYHLIIDYLNYIRLRLANTANLPWGIDQGIHNAYIYTILNSSAVIVPNTSPLILTLGACKSFKQNKNGLLVNNIGEPYAMVHQYDRFGHLIVYFKKLYIGNRLLQQFKKLLFIILP